jgi:DegV family protein with EDD domain
VIALVTDSSAQLPADLRDRYGVRVVPLTIVVDGEDFAEGVDLTSDEFYRRLAAGAVVSTAAPSPGRFLEAYQSAADEGADAVLSIHIGSNTSATTDAATVASRMSPVAVEVVDTGTASFPVACCVWAAAVALERGGDITAAVDAALAVARAVDNVFVVGALDLARRGGRLAAAAEQGEGVPVLALHSGEMEVVDRVHDLDAAVESMAGYVRARTDGRAHRAGVGHVGAADLADALAAQLASCPEIIEIVRYEVGPSVGAHTGIGTAGCVFFPA